MDFGGETVIVVERYDQAIIDGQRVRIHQEELCQALGVYPSGKYQSDDGPGIDAVNALLRQQIRGRGACDAVEEFLDANTYNWLIAGTDAHAKNYSLIRTDNGARLAPLAPLYDEANALPYPEFHPRKIKLAMSVDGEDPFFWAGASIVVAQAEAVGVDPEGLIDRIKSMAERVPDEVSAAISELSPSLSGAEFRARFIDLVAERATLVKRVVKRVTASPSPHARPVTQTRAGELGATKFRGQFVAKDHT